MNFPPPSVHKRKIKKFLFLMCHCHMYVTIGTYMHADDGTSDTYIEVQNPTRTSTCKSDTRKKQNRFSCPTFTRPIYTNDNISRLFH